MDDISPRVLRYYERVLDGASDRRIPRTYFAIILIVIGGICSLPLIQLGAGHARTWIIVAGVISGFTISVGLAYSIWNHGYMLYSKATLLKCTELLDAKREPDAYRTLFGSPKLLHPALVRGDRFRALAGLVLLRTGHIGEARKFLSALNLSEAFNGAVSSDYDAITEEAAAERMMADYGRDPNDADLAIARAGRWGMWFKLALWIWLFIAAILTIVRFIKLK